MFAACSPSSIQVKGELRSTTTFVGRHNRLAGTTNTRIEPMAAAFMLRNVRTGEVSRLRKNRGETTGSKQASTNNDASAARRNVRMPDSGNATVEAKAMSSV